MDTLTGNMVVTHPSELQLYIFYSSFFFRTPNYRPISAAVRKYICLFVLQFY